MNRTNRSSSSVTVCWHHSCVYKLVIFAPLAVVSIVGNVSYEVARDELNLSTLADRRASICSTLFRQITCESHVLQYLLPAQRDAEIASRLRSTNKYPTVRARTSRYKNFYTICAFELSVTVTLSPLYFCLFFIV